MFCSALNPNSATESGQVLPAPRDSVGTSLREAPFWLPALSTVNHTFTALPCNDGFTDESRESVDSPRVSTTVFLLLFFICFVFVKDFFLLLRTIFKVLSNSLQPHGLYSPWSSPGQNTGGGRSLPSPADLPNPGEGIGYPLQYSWASLVAQLVKNPSAMQETWV